MTFTNWELSKPILDALEQQGYVSPTPIQEKAIPAILENRDVLGCAQTGTGKTAAFVIPLLQQIYAKRNNATPNTGIAALIVSPTRELAIQIGETIDNCGKFMNVRYTVICGGVPQFRQLNALRRGVDIIVATPGRLIDLMRQGHINLQRLNHFVLDEADRMLDMGFVNDIKYIISKLPQQKQSLFFSATMDPATLQLANSFLRSPVQIEANRISSPAEQVEQYLFYTEKQNKQSLLVHLLETKNLQTVLVFTQMKHTADRVARNLSRQGIQSESIHGDKGQNNRQATLSKFKNRQLRVLVATDIAARGIDIDQLPYVINYDLPEVPETYIHRIGRTGRAGASGISYSFCDWSEKIALSDIQKLIKTPIKVESDHPFHIPMIAPATVPGNSAISTQGSRNSFMKRRSGKTFMQGR